MLTIDSTSHFIVTDHTVEDMKTNLMWTREDISKDRYTWADAQKAVTKLSIGGFTDWRLPTISELLSLVDYNRSAPAIDSDAFPTCKSDWYWSSTPYASSPGDYAWYVGFNGGNSLYGNRNCKGLVRAVRARQ